MRKLTAIAIATAFAFPLLATTGAAARGANPEQGYLSVLHNLVEKGVNHGRCNAVGILAEKILLTGADLPALVPVHVADECLGRDVFLSDDIVEHDEPIDGDLPL